MKIALLFFASCLLSSVALLPDTVSAQSVTSLPAATLYSPVKYRQTRSNYCLNFQPGTVFPGGIRSCDLRYGAMWAGNEKDWFESSAGPGNRSVIKDLGAYSWDAPFAVPYVEPLVKLKPGERRHITVDISGADGADGKPGAPGADADGVVRYHPNDIPVSPTRPKRDGKPKVDPMWVKAVVGHLYVIHVVDDLRDFYALFRVESLESADHCTISWKLIPPPQPPPDKIG